MADSRLVPFARPSIGEREEAAALRVLRSGWLTTGPECTQFEAEFAKLVGAKYAVALNSCTAALQLALCASGVRPGDHVVMSTWTFASAANVVKQLGAIPVFVDVEFDTLNASDELTAMAIEKSGATAAIVTHFAGLACEMMQTESAAKATSCALIEDAAHALPTWFGTNGPMVGGPGKSLAACFSFYATKSITSGGEGGMLTTNYEIVEHYVRQMSLHGMNAVGRDRYTEQGARRGWEYEIEIAGYKANMSDLAAAIGRAQLRGVMTMRRRREQIATRYLEGLKPRWLDLPEPGGRGAHAWHLFVVKIRAGERKEVIERLANKGVMTSVHFRPLHTQPLWKTPGTSRLVWMSGPGKPRPVSEMMYERVISLPIYSAMSDEDVSYVIERVNETMEEVSG